MRKRPTTLLGFYCLLAVAFVALSACEDPKPSMTGRLTAPSDLLAFSGCRQGVDTCEADQERPLLAVVCAGSDVLRIFDVEQRAFFSSYNPLFPLSVPVGEHPVAIAGDPQGSFAFVLNSLTEDLSLVDLHKRVEVDADRDSSTCAASLPERSDRCRAGVSRVALSWEADRGALLPEDVVCPAGLVDPSQPLPIWVSLAGSGQLARVDFTYPDVQGELPQRADLVQVLDLGGVPSGLAIKNDGTVIFVADEASDSIAAVETATGNVVRIDVGGPSRRLALTPDERTLYVLRLNEPVVALVDAVALTRKLPGATDVDTARDPDSDGLSILLPGVPRSVEFVSGKGVEVFSETGDSIGYTTELLGEDERDEQEQEVVKTFAYVSNMDGNMYILDAVNHRAIDELPFIGPGLAEVAFVLDGEVYESGELQDCYALDSCAFPTLVDVDRIYDGDTELEPIYYGIWLNPGVTRTEGWIITYEGVLPGSDQSSTGRLSANGLSDSREGLDFAAMDVQPGDHLLVLSPPSGSQEAQVPDACVADGQSLLHREFEIQGVEAGELQLSVPAGVQPEMCWTGNVRYEIRASEAWTVVGTVSGLHPRLTMLPAGSDAPETPAYDNGLIALSLIAPGPDADGNPQSIPRDAAFGFNTDSGFEIYAFRPSIRAGMAGELLSLDVDKAEDEDGLLADDRLFLLFEGSNAMMEMFPSQFESSNYLLYQ